MDVFFGQLVMLMQRDLKLVVCSDLKTAHLSVEKMALFHCTSAVTLCLCPSFVGHTNWPSEIFAR